MNRRILISSALLLLFLSGVVAAQTKLTHLRVWVDKYPTHKSGRLTKNFFQSPSIQKSLQQLLTRKDYDLLTKIYKVETPIKQMGDFLAVKVCRPHACDTDQAGFAVNLRTGFIYVRMQEGETTRWFSSKETYTALPQSVQNYLNDFAAT